MKKISIVTITISFALFFLNGCKLINEVFPKKNLCVDESSKIANKLDELNESYSLDSSGLPYKVGEFVVTFTKEMQDSLNDPSKNYKIFIAGFENKLNEKLTLLYKNSTEIIKESDISYQYCECHTFAIVKINGGVVAPNDRPIGDTQSYGVKNITPNYISVNELNKTGNEQAADFQEFINNAPIKNDKDVVISIIDTGLDFDKVNDNYNVYNRNIYDFIWKRNSVNSSCGISNDVVGWNFDNQLNGETATLDRMPYDGDLNKHGTHLFSTVLGAASASKSNGFKTMFVKAFNDNGVGSLSSVSCALYYSANRGAKAINASFVFKSKDIKNFYPLSEAIAYAKSKNVLIIAAAGNNKCQLNEDYLFYPAQAYGKTHEDILLDNIVCVTGVVRNNGTSNYQIGSDYANYGSNFVHIGAQGTTNNLFYNSNPLSGTSIATAMVTGYAASLLSLNPNTNWSYNVLRDNILNGNQTIRAANLQTEIQDCKVLTVWLP